MGDDQLRQLAFRVPESMVARIDACAELMRKQNPGLAPSRSDVVRVLLEKGLAEFMREHLVPNTPGATISRGSGVPFPTPKRRK